MLSQVYIYTILKALILLIIHLLMEHKMFIYHHKYIYLIILYMQLIIIYFQITELHFRKKIKMNKMVIYNHHKQVFYLMLLDNNLYHHTQQIKQNIINYILHLLIITFIHIFYQLFKPLHIINQQLYQFKNHILYQVYINNINQVNNIVNFNIIIHH